MDWVLCASSCPSDINDRRGLEDMKREGKGSHRAPHSPWRTARAEPMVSHVQWVHGPLAFEVKVTWTIANGASCDEGLQT